MSLRILTQPGTDANGVEFYKDEGGKGNWMSLKVALVNSNKKSNQKLELRSELYFESGLPVEASDQKILLVRYKGISGLHDEDQSNDSSERTVVLNKKDLLKSNNGVTLEYRIQKVSRRKDNQRFLVRISTSDDCIEPVYSRPITVLSKRKIPARLRNDPEAIMRYKAEKISKAESNRSSKRSRSTEATPELRPLTVVNGTQRDSFAPSKKRSRISGNTSTTNDLKNKIDQMSHTINQLYDMMQDQRIQINVLQEQVRTLNDSNMGLGFAVLDGAFEEVGSTSNTSIPPPSSMKNNMMLTGLEMLSTSSDDISKTFDDTTEKAMAQDLEKKTLIQWNYGTNTAAIMPPPTLSTHISMPVLNL